MGTKLLVVYEYYVVTASDTYRHMEKLLPQYGGQVRAISVKKIRATDLEWCDVVLSIRSTCNLSAAVARLCQKYQRLHITTVDDNLLAVSRTDRYMQKRQNYFLQTLKSSDVLLTPNQLLTEMLLTHVPVPRTAHSDTQVELSEIHPPTVKRHNNTPFRIVYYCNNGSTDYFMTIMQPVISQLKKTTGRDIEVSLIGIQKIEGLNADCQVNYIPHMALPDFRTHMRTTGYNLGIAPLVESDGFSQYKYFNKFMEFSMAGIPGVYSNCPPYTFVIHDGKNGLLSNSTPESWLEVLQRAINNPDLLQSCVEYAQEQLRTEFSPKSINDSLIRQIPELVNYNAPHAHIPSILPAQICYRTFMAMEKVDAVWRSLKIAGIQGVVKKTKSYLTAMQQYQKDYKTYKKRRTE